MLVRNFIMGGLSLILIAACLIIYWPTKGIPVLAYHKVSNDDSIYSIDKEQFDWQMKYLVENGYTTISLSQLADSQTGNAPLPPKPVIITFDDGYEDNYTTALPILNKYGLTAAIFITVDKVGQPGYLSWKQINTLQARGVDIGSHTLSHSALTEIADADRKKEITTSKALLDQHLVKPIDFLAYPHGKYSRTFFNELQQAGYRGAFTGQTGLNFPSTDPYQLKRISIIRPVFSFWNFELRLARATIYGKLGI